MFLNEDISILFIYSFLTKAHIINGPGENGAAAPPLATPLPPPLAGATAQIDYREVL